MIKVTESGGPFEFTAENKKQADAVIAKYPEGRQASAVMPLLWIAQNQNDNWLSREAIEYVADYIGISNIRALEVATFYTMYNLEPIGKFHIQLCGTTPCWLRGSDDVMRACNDFGIVEGQTTDDGLFHLTEVECLGACVNAPMVQINEDYFEDLDYDSMTNILRTLKDGKKPAPGPQIERHFSAPVGGPTVLKDNAGRAEND